MLKGASLGAARVLATVQSNNIYRSLAPCLVFYLRHTSTFKFSTMAESVPAKTPVPLTAKPAVGQLVEHHGQTYTTIKEGLAYVLIPPEATLLTDPNKVRDGTHKAQSVFYNPIQQFNRDLSVLAIRVFGELHVHENKGKQNRTLKRRLYQQEKAAKKNKDKDKEEKSASDSKQAPGQANHQQEPDTLKRKAPPSSEDGETLQPGSGAPSPKKQKHQQETPFPGSSRPTEDDRPVFSSNISLAPDAADEFDESFGDGGIADEDFLAAEEKIRQAGLLPSPSFPSPLNTNNGHLHAAPTTPQPKPKDTRVPFRVLDALSATGLRALRYAKEIPFVTSITANDLSADAVASIVNNVTYNGLDESKVIKPTTGNAIAHMANVMSSESHQKYTVIDLDPYGTAIPFLDTAVQAVANGGLLCVTCTDASVFNSVGFLEKTYSQYGGLPIKGDSYAEGGLRLILNSIAVAAGKYGIAMEPLLSLSIDFYARVFVRLRRSPSEVKLQASKTMVVYSCDAGCGAWKTQPFVRSQPRLARNGDVNYKHTASLAPTASPLCEHCGFKTHLAGPMYAGPLHNPEFVQSILDLLPVLDKDVYQTTDRIRGMLTTVLEETDNYTYPESPAPNPKPAKKGAAAAATTAAAADVQKEAQGGEARSESHFTRMPESMIDHHPLFIVPSSLSKVLHCSAPSTAQFQGAIRHLGYRCGRSHAKPGSVKTDAPWTVLWDIMREWVRQKSPVKEGSLTEKMAGWKIMHGKAPSSEDKADDGGEWEEVLKQSDELKVVKGEDGEYRVMRRRPAAEKGTTTTDALTSDEGKGKEEPPKVVFDESLGNRGRGAARGLVRYQINPRENWGPMTRAKSTTKAKE
jgi:tRNA (guanine26-N2/guanine27-N2)-dimethyltransferase